jgi:hypothetical protein
MELKPKQHYEDDSKDKEIQKEPDDVPFWSKNPNVILSKEHILEFFPTEEMTFNQKLNAISRIVILLTLLTFAYTQNLQILVVGAVSLFFIFMLHQYRSKEEGFEISPVLKDLVDTSHSTPESVFQMPTANNPLGNVLDRLPV